MKLILLAGALLAATTPIFAADVGVSVNIGQPGFYGRLDIGDYPAPRVIYRQPVLIERTAIAEEPVYLRVPRGHAKNWRRHCHKYDACGERVYFVQDNWYNREYVPRYRQRMHGHQNERRGERRDERRNDHRGEQSDDHRGGDHDHGRKH